MAARQPTTGTTTFSLTILSRLLRTTTTTNTNASSANAATERTPLLARHSRTNTTITTNTTHDLDTSSDAGSICDGPKCWCCWERTSTPSNPLIRVCLSCRDPDLQFIHQQCIDSYVTALPLPRHIQNNPENYQFRCTRCNDLYNVKVAPVPRLVVIANDKFLAAAFTTMLVCILTLTVCCISLVVENWGTGNLLFDIAFGPMRLSMSIVFFAILMLIVCHALNAVTCCIMFDFAKGRVIRHVIGISEDKIVASAESSVSQENQSVTERAVIEDLA